MKRILNKINVDEITVKISSEILARSINKTIKSENHNLNCISDEDFVTFMIKIVIQILF